MRFVGIRADWTCLAQNPSGAASGSSPTKKDPNAPLPTPLEKLLLEAGPIRTDGSDKFFGFENVSEIALLELMYWLIGHLLQFGSTW